MKVSSVPAADGRKESTELVEKCPVVTLQLQPVRKGLSRTQRRRRQRKNRIKASPKVRDQPTVEWRGAVTTTAMKGPSGSAIVSEATPDLQEWRVWTGLGEGVLADLLPDLS